MSGAPRLWLIFAAVKALRIAITAIPAVLLMLFKRAIAVLLMLFKRAIAMLDVC
jgi:hypothetical protein